MCLGGSLLIDYLCGRDRGRISPKLGVDATLAEAIKQNRVVYKFPNMFWPMRSGIFREDEGFDVIVNGVARYFLYMEVVAYDSARVLKQRHPQDMVEIRIRATGERVVMREYDRTGLARSTSSQNG